MENCLVTKLKKNVQNDNLPTLGFITLAVDTELAATAALEKRRIDMQFVLNSEVELKNIGGNFLDSEGNVLGDTLEFTEVSGLKPYYFSANTKYILIPQEKLYQFKNALGYVNNLGTTYFRDTKELVYASNLYFIEIFGEKNILTLTDFNNWIASNLSLRFNTITCTGNISVLKDIIKKTTLISLTGPFANTLTGDFASLASSFTEAKTIKVIVNYSSSMQLTCNGNRLGHDGSTYSLAYDGAGHVTCTLVS